MNAMYIDLGGHYTLVYPGGEGEGGGGGGGGGGCR